MDDSDALTRREFLQLTTAAAAVAAVSDVALAAPGTQRVAIAQYVLMRLQQLGVDALFGVPGATCDPLFAAAEKLGLKLVTTSSDLEAGYAADGYARMRGLGAVSVTYGVGMLSLAAAISGAFAEHSPVVVINGGPSAEDLHLQREWETGFSHSNGRPSTDLNVFRELTEAAVRVESAAEAPKQIDTLLTTAMRTQRPVYLEIPKHLWEVPCSAPAGALDVASKATGQEPQLAAAIVERLRNAKRPALLLGAEVLRYGLDVPTIFMVQNLNIPYATTLLGKSAIPEGSQGFSGVYDGDRAPASVKQVIEGADALLALGCVMGRQYRTLVTRTGDSLIRANEGEVRFGRKVAGAASLGALVASLRDSGWQGAPRYVRSPERPQATSFGYDAVIAELGRVIDESFVLLTDTSLSMYPAAQLYVVGAKSFVCNAVWQAIGYSVAAAVGVGMAQKKRPLVLCGDGGFQMTAQALSTLARQQIRAIVVVLDNAEYGIEQWLLDPRYFKGSAPLKPHLALNRWDYVALARSLGVSTASTADSIDSFRRALAEAKHASGPALIQARFDPRDLPSELRA